MSLLLLKSGRNSPSSAKNWNTSQQNLPKIDIWDPSLYEKVFQRQAKIVFLDIVNQLQSVLLDFEIEENLFWSQKA